MLVSVLAADWERERETEGERCRKGEGGREI